MVKRDVVVIGASAGGIQALQTLLKALPGNFDASVLVVLHTSNHAGSFLPQILQRAGNLPVFHPTDKCPIAKRNVYVAPPDFHMIVEGDILRVVKGPRENLHRPAIDPLFRSAAASYGRRVIGVILTGLLDDGTSGLMLVQAQGGEAVIQDPSSALFSAMPENALEEVPKAHVLPLEQIPNLLMRLTSESPPEEASSRKQLPSTDSVEAEREIKIAEFDMSGIGSEDHVRQPSVFGCPGCGGVLWEMEDDPTTEVGRRSGPSSLSPHGQLFRLPS